MKIRTIVSLFSVLLFVQPAVSFAGAGADVFACISMPTRPVEAMVARVSVGGSGSSCMNHTAQKSITCACDKPVEILVDSAGLNCARVGYVESKSSSTKGDTCATDESIWPLNYSIEKTDPFSGNRKFYSGSTLTLWSAAGLRNTIQLRKQSSETWVCDEKVKCDKHSLRWDKGTQGPLYIIFSLNEE